MAKKTDFNTEWEKIKKNLTEYGKEAKKIAKKSEKEIVRLSQKGKLHFDIAALSLKQEQLYYQIGKEYIKAKCSETESAKLKKLVEEIKKVSVEHKSLERKVKKIK